MNRTQGYIVMMSMYILSRFEEPTWLELSMFFLGVLAIIISYFTDDD